MLALAGIPSDEFAAVWAADTTVRIRPRFGGAGNGHGRQRRDDEGKWPDQAPQQEPPAAGTASTGGDRGTHNAEQQPNHGKFHPGNTRPPPPRKTCVKPTTPAPPPRRNSRGWESVPREPIANLDLPWRGPRRQ